MNKTESRARRWIAKNHGVSEQEVVFSPSRTPDFVTPDGAKYEVKRLYGDKIIIYPAQEHRLRLERDIIVAVFGNSSFKPVALLEAGKVIEALDDGRKEILNIKLVSMGHKHLVTLPRALDARLKKCHDHMFLPGDSYIPIFAKAIADYLEKRGY